MAMTQESGRYLPYVPYVRPMICPFPHVHSRDRTSFYARNIFSELNGENHGKIWGHGTPNWRLWKIPLVMTVTVCELENCPFIYICDLYTDYIHIIYILWFTIFKNADVPSLATAKINGNHPVSSGITYQRWTQLLLNWPAIHQSPFGTLW